MNKKSYSEKLRDPRWQRKRLEVLQRDRFCCRTCFDESSTLNVHHLSYHGEPWESPLEKLVALCCHCHEVVSTLKIDIERAIDTPLACCLKWKQGDSFVGVFQHIDGVIFFKTDGDSVEIISNMADSFFRNIAQSVFNNWQFYGKNYLIIDQSPIQLWRAV